jgi:hypothetical protein
MLKCKRKIESFDIPSRGDEPDKRPRVCSLHIPRTGHELEVHSEGSQWAEVSGNVGQVVSMHKVGAQSVGWNVLIALERVEKVSKRTLQKRMALRMS